MPRDTQKTKAEKVVTKVTDAQLSISCQQNVVGLEIAVQHLWWHPINQSTNQLRLTTLQPNVRCADTRILRIAFSIMTSNEESKQGFEQTTKRCVLFCIRQIRVTW